jgi:hypothetical protein
MRQRVFATALVAALVSACGEGGGITEPQAASKVRALAAIGTDSVTGATIETNKDDYAPGEIIHVAGRGWSPNEIVHLFMTEAPDTHGDVSQDVTADSAGAFSIHYYDVQQHDLGVTFTLTATGQTSGSTATAVFTDGSLSVDANGLPNSGGSRVFSPNADGSLDDATLNASINGSGAETDVLIDVRTGTSMSGTSVRTLGPGVSYNPPPNGASFSRVWDGKNNSNVDVAEGVYTARIYSTAQALPVAPAEVTGARRAQLLVDRTPPVLSAVQLTPNATTPGASVTFTATATDALTPITDAEYRIDAGAWLTMTPTAPPFNALSEGLTVTFTAPGAGNHNVCVRARDVGLTWSNGNSCATLVVTGANQLPTANAKGPYSGTEGSPIALTGEGSDPDGGPVTFAWSVNAPAGVCTIAAPTSPNTSITCDDNDDGSWMVTLTVTDDEDTPATSTATLTVANVAPTINAKTAGVNVNEGSSIAFAVSNVTDPSTADATAGFTYAFACDGVNFGSYGPSSTVTCPAGDGPGSVTIAAKAKDKDNGESAVVSSTFTVLNVAPSVDAGTATATIDEGSTFSRAGSFTDPGPDSWTATVDYGDGGGAVALSLAGDKTFNLSHTYTNDGVFTVTVTVNDDDGGSNSDQITVTVNNVLPVVYPGLGATINEGSTFSRNGSFTDPGADTWSATVDYGDGSGVESLALSGKNFSLSHTYADDTNGPFTITIKVNDDDGFGSATVTITVLNVAPTLNAISGSVAPVAVNTSTSITFDFSDPAGTNDTYTGSVNWGDGNTSSGTITPGGSLPHTYTSAGVYTVCATVSDEDGGTSAEKCYSYVVVYDPNAGFVTGGGWINSPVGAYAAYPALTGKATFGFVSKYKKGMTTPDGNTEFQFHAAGMNFKSSAYEWLVVSGVKAQFKGTGTINGSGNYGFLLTAIDGQLNGGGGTDKFRIKIWDKNNNDAVVYDNQVTGDNSDTANPTTTLGGGSINIQAK